MDTTLNQVLQMVPSMEQAPWKDSFQIKYIVNLLSTRVEKWFEMSRREGSKTITEKVRFSVRRRSAWTDSKIGIEGPNFEACAILAKVFGFASALESV